MLLRTPLANSESLTNSNWSSGMCFALPMVGTQAAKDGRKLTTRYQDRKKWRFTVMTTDERDILELLKEELDFIEKGGYGRSVRTPWQSKSTVQDSLSCINYGSHIALTRATSATCSILSARN